MAYARRSTYRRKGRRGNRTLSTRRIFNNKSAKAQAKQIYALRRSVNRIAKANKPEVKLVRSTPDLRTVGWVQSASGSPGTVGYFSFTLPTPSPGTFDTQRIGNLIKLYPSKVFLTAQYNEHFTTIPNMTVEHVGGQIRIIAVQTKTSTSARPTIDDIMRDNYYDDQPNPIAGNFMMTMPFKNGITSRFNVLYDRRFNINKDKPMFTKRITIKPASRSMRWEEGVSFPKGEITVFVLAGGFFARRNESGEDYVWDFTAADVQWQTEVPFTDA